MAWSCNSATQKDAEVRGLRRLFDLSMAGKSAPGPMICPTRHPLLRTSIARALLPSYSPDPGLPPDEPPPPLEDRTNSKSRVWPREVNRTYGSTWTSSTPHKYGPGSKRSPSRWSRTSRSTLTTVLVVGAARPNPLPMAVCPSRQKTNSKPWFSPGVTVVVHSKR